MVRILNIGVIGLQGAISEHLEIINKALKNKNLSGNVINIRKKDQLKNIDALIIPGGESTTISKLLIKNDLFYDIKQKIKNKEIAVMGTCAGCIILSNKIIDDNKDIKILKSINIEIVRNYYGRQKFSFEKKVEINDFKKPFNAVFIRAPVIEKVGKNCRVISKIEDKVIMVRQDNILALTFHPELTTDSRIHEYFLDMI